MLERRFQCAVIVIHHCGINETRPRGHTSLTSAAEAQIGVKRDADERIVTQVEYMKDGPEGERIVSRLDVVTVGVDEDGEDLTSCVVVAADDEEIVLPPCKLSPAQQIAMRQLARAITEEGEIPPATTACRPAYRV